MVKRHLFIIIFLCVCLSCSQQQKPLEINQKPYFDVAQYFKNEARRLQSRQQNLQKTVSKNDQQETKRIQIEDWMREFELFTSSDINKADWLGSYNIDSTTQKVSYTRKDPKLRTARIDVYSLPDGRVKQVQIINSDKNWLYSSDEKLDYFPDSLYRIHKEQSILFLGENQYTVGGVFIK